jgi:hypothetical protein
MASCCSIPPAPSLSVRQNVSFLRRVVGDGSAAATFCRMLPYGGTPIREVLAREGRLKGDVTGPDYDFHDPRLNRYFDALNGAVSGWIHGEGVSHQLNWAWHEVGVLRRLFPAVDRLDDYKSILRALTTASNDLLFTTVEASAEAWERGDATGFDETALTQACRDLAARLLEQRNGFILRNQDVLLDALAADRIAGPIVSPQIF